MTLGTVRRRRPGRDVDRHRRAVGRLRPAGRRRRDHLSRRHGRARLGCSASPSARPPAARPGPGRTCSWSGCCGTVAGSWPSEGTSVMVLPYGAFVGFCVAPIDHRIQHAGRHGVVVGPGRADGLEVRRLQRGRRPAAQVMPASEGTVTSGGPSESTTVTVEPSFCDTPGFGLCDTTSPAATVIDFTGAPSFRFMWTLSTAARAWASGRFDQRRRRVRRREHVGLEGDHQPGRDAAPAARAPPTITPGPAALRAPTGARRFAGAGIGAPPRALRAAAGLGVEDLPRPGLRPDRAPPASPARSPCASPVDGRRRHPPATTPESVSSDTPGARNPVIGADVLELRA